MTIFLYMTSVMIPYHCHTATARPTLERCFEQHLSLHLRHVHQHRHNHQHHQHHPPAERQRHVAGRPAPSASLSLRPADSASGAQSCPRLRAGVISTYRRRRRRSIRGGPVRAGYGVRPRGDGTGEAEAKDVVGKRAPQAPVWRPAERGFASRHSQTCPLSRLVPALTVTSHCPVLSMAA